MRVQIRKELFMRDHFHGAGIDFIQAALDFFVPGGLNLRGRAPVILDKRTFDQPFSLLGGELANLFEKPLRVWTHDGIVARKPRVPANDVGMKWALLYAVTATVIGIYSFYQLSAMMWGAPINWFSCAALLGSMVLLIAGVLVFSRLRASAVAGLIGAILIWIYCGPLLVLATLAPYSFWQDLKFNLHFHDYVPVAGPLLGIVLLVLTTLHSISVLRKSGSKQAVTN